MNPIKSCTQVNQANLTIGVYEGMKIGEGVGAPLLTIQKALLIKGLEGVLGVLRALEVISIQSVLCVLD